MEAQEFTFENLPKTVGNLWEDIKEIKRLLSAPQKETPENNNLLTISQAAKFLSLSTATLYSKVSRRELPVMKQNGRLYFMQSELLDYLKAGRKQTNAELAEQTLSKLRK
ncbi:MAG: helix-turn-helix domain-containing protein [Bacteroidia bacterium]|nr:helix-turn-helix domain-containing protein [Bacteroidia bacterium]